LQNPDKWYRLATILACASIVVTAVYILRAAGKTVMGPISEAYAGLTMQHGTKNWQQYFY